MKTDLISIQEAAELSNKSVQTIRRAIKTKKLKSKKTKTPQGFNYLMSREAVCGLYKIKTVEKKASKKSASTSRTTKQKNTSSLSTDTAVSIGDLAEFNRTLQDLIREHSQERQNYLRLIQVMQEKMIALENKFTLLKATNEKSWYQFWK